MKILMAVSSKHGATREIGNRIDKILCSYGHTVQQVPPSQICQAQAVDRVIIGSSLYMGGWNKDLVAAVPSLCNLGSTMPVWAFSSGPVGNPAMPTEDPGRVLPLLAKLEESVDFRGHEIWPGKVEYSSLSFGERAIVRAMKVPVGDFRPWNQIDAWVKNRVLSV